jgi:hypothetical protein
MVLQTGQEINELDQSGFYTQGPTVFTGNIGGNKYIVQVFKNILLSSANSSYYLLHEC